MIRQQAFVGWLISLVTGIIKLILVIFNQGNANFEIRREVSGGKKEEEWNREGGSGGYCQEIRAFKIQNEGWLGIFRQ